MKKWYRNVNRKPVGPYTDQEMRNFIRTGEVGPFDLIMNESKSSDWIIAIEGGFEQNLFPAAQGFVPGLELALDVKEWVLLFVGSEGSAQQEGPYSIQEIRHFLNEHRLSPYQYIWKQGLSGWCQVKDRPEFSSIITSEMLTLESF